jgi:transposase
MISEEEFMDVRALHRQGLSFAEIGRLLGRDWRTVRRYLVEGAQPAYRRRRLPSKLDPYKPVIDQWLAKTPPLEATRIHQDLVRDYGFAGGYQTVRRYVERARPRREAGPEERFETAPGQQAQVDWAHEEPLQTPSGLELPLYSFHMVLGHSRDSFVCLTASQDLVSFWACHRAAFAHFGGVPRELLYDRTKTVVREHVGRLLGLEEVRFHPEALASAAHYGFRLRLCRPYRPQTKGKVESDVGYVRGRLCRGHRWRSYEQANAAWRAWNDEVARVCTERTARWSRAAPSATGSPCCPCRSGPTSSSAAPVGSSPATASSTSRAAATSCRGRSPASGSSSSSAPRSSRSTRSRTASGSPATAVASR